MRPIRVLLGYSTDISAYPKTSYVVITIMELAPKTPSIRHRSKELLKLRGLFGCRQTLPEPHLDPAKHGKGNPDKVLLFRV